ncbi:hypothetical protein M9Y10_011757 [Tritrichomonas musculus]|uniref:Uncharacterized protein n=1 Tax=Tritrichomonas musculus TaxID=1915356 RepID=A0ABR2IK44_9EUKA
MSNPLFPGNAVWREHSQWTKMFTTPVSIENSSQLFTNFGSKNETSNHETDFNSIIDSISEKLAIDVFHAIRSEIIPIPNRSSHTACGDRKPNRPVTGNQPVRIIKTNHAAIPKGRVTQFRTNIDKAVSKSRLTNI